MKKSAKKNREIETPKIKTDLQKPKKAEGWKELGKTFIWAAVLAVLIRSFLFEPFHIPSSSMKPNLLIGDYIFVSKFSFGYSKYSFPLNSFDLFDERFWQKRQPQRGEVVVFRFPTDPNINYIKRIVGLPGDKIQMIDGQLYINDKKISKIYAGDFLDDDGRLLSSYHEKIDNKEFLVLDQYLDLPQDNTDIYEVPQNHYFAMGDNRYNSEDSRFLDAVGFIPAENLVGPAKIIFFSSEEPIWKFWRWFDAIRFGRIFQKIN